MNGRQITSINYVSDISRSEPLPADGSQCFATDFMHPDAVVGDLRLTHDGKREILASWASDARAVPNAPALRQLDNGAVVRIDDILRALKSLDEGEAPEHTTFDPVRSSKRGRIRLPLWLRLPPRRGWPDDDDPPPCPAMIAGPPGGPLSGGETADLGLALAA